MSPTNGGEAIADSPLSSLYIIAKKIQTNPKSPAGNMVQIHFHAHYSSHLRRQSAWLRSKMMPKVISLHKGDNVIHCSFLFISLFQYPVVKSLTQ